MFVVVFVLARKTKPRLVEVEAVAKHGRTILHWISLADNVTAAHEKIIMDSIMPLMTPRLAQSRDEWDQTPLICASFSGKSPIVEFLMSEGNSEVNAADTNGYTALHHAVTNGFEKVAYILVMNGADLSLRNREGDTPIDIVDKILSSRYHKRFVAFLFFSNSHVNYDLTS